MNKGPDDETHTQKSCLLSIGMCTLRWNGTNQLLNYKQCVGDGGRQRKADWHKLSVGEQFLAVNIQEELSIASFCIHCQDSH